MCFVCGDLPPTDKWQLRKLVLVAANDASNPQLDHFGIIRPTIESSLEFTSAQALQSRVLRSRRPKRSIGVDHIRTQSLGVSLVEFVQTVKTLAVHSIVCVSVLAPQYSLVPQDLK